MTLKRNIFEELYKNGKPDWSSYIEIEEVNITQPEPSQDEKDQNDSKDATNSIECPAINIKEPEDKFLLDEVLNHINGLMNIDINENLQPTAEKATETSKTDFKPKKYQILFSKEENRHYLLEKLQALTVTKGVMIVNQKAFEVIAAILNIIQRRMVEDPALSPDKSPETLYHLLRLGAFLHTSKNKYLLNEIKGEHSLWDDVTQWKAIYEFCLTKKLEACAPKTLASNEDGKNEKVGGGNKKEPFLGKLFTFGKKKSFLDINEEKIVKATILEELNQYLTHFTNGEETFIKLIKAVNADTFEAVHLLERHNHKKNEEFLDIIRQYCCHKDRKITTRMDIIKVLIIPYLSSPSDLVTCLLVSKVWNQELAAKVYKQVIRSDYPRTIPLTKRLNLWECFLHQSLKRVDCSAIETIASSTKMKTPLEDIIELDVLRSMHLHRDTFSHDSLRLLLRAYAISNQEVGYCQGMNYVMGFLLIILRDEKKTFKFFTIIMDQLLAKIILNDFSKLKMFFCILDRLIYVFTPSIAEHFKREKLEVSYFATSWFITLFSSAYQHTLTSSFVLDFWDFILTVKSHWLVPSS